MIDAETREGVLGRRRVDELLRTDVGKAEGAALAIRHPWYRCQAITAVARAVSETGKIKKLLTLALNAASEQDEPNRVVSVASWPLSTLITGDPAQTRTETLKLLKLIAPEPNCVRRADGLLMLISAVHSDPGLRQAVLMPLLAAIKESKGRKAPRILAALSLLLAMYDRQYALDVLNQIPETREIRQARRFIVAGENIRVPFNVAGQ